MVSVLIVAYFMRMLGGGGIASMGESKVEVAKKNAPLLLQDNTDMRVPYVDASGGDEQELFGMIEHNPLGFMGEPPHRRVKPGAIHRGSGGVVFIDEIDAVSHNPQMVSILKTVMQENFMSIRYIGREAGGEHGVVTEPAACKVSLVCGGNEDALSFSKDTEILTYNGWMNITEINEDTSLLTLNPNTHGMSYNKPLLVKRYKYNGKMYSLRTTMIDLMVTPEHELYVKPRRKKEYIKMQAKNFFGKEQYKFLRSGVWSGIERNVPFILNQKKTEWKTPSVCGGKQINEFHTINREYSEKHIPFDTFIEFFGYYISEGSLSGRTKNLAASHVTLAQNKGEKADKIKACIEKLNIPYSEKLSGELIHWNIKSPQLADYLDKFGKANEKYIPREFLILSKRQLQILFDALFLGDGWRGKTQWIYITTSKQLADDVQEIALKIGMSANIRLRKSKERNDGYVRKDTYAVSIKLRGQEPEKRIKRCNQIGHETWVDYNDEVICPVVPPDGIVYVRRNGIPIWCCNSKIHPAIRCYDDKTELLTKVGWKLFKDLKYNDEVATLNNRGHLEYQKPTHIMQYHYNDKMISIKTRAIDLVVTPNHELYVKPVKIGGHYKEFNSTLDYEFIRADALIGKDAKFKRTAKWIGSSASDVVIPEFILKREIDTYGGTRHIVQEKIYSKYSIPIRPFLKLLGFYLSEGSASHIGRSYCVRMSQNSDRYLDEIIDAVNECGIKYKVYQDKRREKSYIVEIGNPQTYDYFKKFGKADEKYIPKWVKEMSLPKLRIFFDALMKGDGTFINGRPHKYVTTSKRLADDVQEILVKMGYAGTVRVDRVGDGKWKTCYAVGIHTKRLLEPEKRAERAEEKIIDYNGTVYCCEVPNHTLYVRRNGKSVWCGNSRLYGEGWETFTKVKMDNNAHNKRFIFGFIHNEQYLWDRLPLTRAAGIRIVEEALEWGGGNHITLRLRDLGGIVMAASRYARAEGLDITRLHHVERAVEEHKTVEEDEAEIKREERLSKLNVFIDGNIIGRVNGLGVRQFPNGRMIGTCLPVVCTVAKGVSNEKPQFVSLGAMGKSAVEGVEVAAALLMRYFDDWKSLKGSIIYVTHAQSYHNTHPETYEEMDGIRGRSATIDYVVALFSLLWNIKVRQDCAMTGSVDVGGMIEPIGGTHAKIRAAEDLGIKRVLIPLGNLDDVDPQRYKCEVIPCKTITEYLESALDWSDVSEEQELKLLNPLRKDDEQRKGVRHND